MLVTLFCFLFRENYLILNYYSESCFFAGFYRSSVRFGCFLYSFLTTKPFYFTVSPVKAYAFSGAKVIIKPAALANVKQTNRHVNIFFSVLFIIISPLFLQLQYVATYKHNYHNILHIKLLPFLY